MPTSTDRAAVPLPLLYSVFFLSGFAALIYQIVWQRTLFALYGLDVESATIVVSAFMLGLGLGSLLGGALSKDPRRSLLATFGAIECSMGVFGLVSLDLFRWIGGFTAGGSKAVTFLSTFLLIVIPTLLMGATLPLLVAYAVSRLRNVGRSVGVLYAVNTLGSACAAFATAVLLLGRLGQRRTVLVAAALNLAIGATVLLLARERRAA